MWPRATRTHQRNRAGRPAACPAGSASLSSNSGAGAVLWCSVPSGDANSTITAGRLIAYDPDQLASGTIPAIWDSQTWGINFIYNKFIPPVIWGGQVYVPNYSGGVDVYR